MNTKIPITLAFSPDTDDAFMVHGLESGAVDTGPYQFQLISADIQQLNEEAFKGTYDLTAISLAVFPRIQEHYELVPIGSSIGDGFGPALVVSKKSFALGLKNPEDLKHLRVAVPGLQTSAYFALRILIGDFEPVPTLFSEITSRVASGDCDAGVLIHELQMWNTHPDLVKIGDVGQLWQKRFNLPLPLGGNAIHRRLGPDHIASVTQILRSSIHYGFLNRERTLDAALRRSGAQISKAEGDRYIEMYVNDHSLRFAPPVREAIKLLLNRGADLGLCPPLMDQTHL